MIPVNLYKFSIFLLIQSVSSVFRAVGLSRLMSHSDAALPSSCRKKMYY